MNFLPSFDWQRPLAFAGLLLPIALLIAARWLDRPTRAFTGTIEVWRRIAGTTPVHGARSRRRIPPALLLLSLALVCATLALAGPSLSGAAKERWTIEVDRSPSMYLANGSRTRLEVALEAVRRLAARHGAPELRWSTAGESSVEAETPPADWLLAPRVPSRPLASFAPDVAGHVWLTDCAPEPPPLRAGWVASGGANVPGPIGVRGAALVMWDGESTHEIADSRPQARVEVELGPSGAGALPGALSDILAAWASARGFELVGTSATVLTLRQVAMEEAQAITCARDGWQARGRAWGTAPTRDASGPLEPWCRDEVSGRVLVAAGPGRVVTSIGELDAPGGDPAAFAVSWSQLFDRCALAVPGIVELSERLSAGETSMSVPREAAAATLSEAPTLAGWCAWLGVAFALSAALVARRSDLG